MRYYSEDSDARQEERGEGEEGYDHGLESGLADGFRDAVLHGSDIEYGHVGINRTDDLCDGRCHRHGIAGCAQDQTTVSERDVELGRGGHIEGSGLHIAGDANDGHPNEIAFGIAAWRRHADLLADGALGEEGTRQGFVDHHDAWKLAREIRSREGATGAQGNLEGLEIIEADRGQRSELVCSIVRSAFDAERISGACIDPGSAP